MFEGQEESVVANLASHAPPYADHSACRNLRCAAGVVRPALLRSAKIRSSSDEMVFMIEAAEDGVGLHGIGLCAAMS